MTEAAHVLVVDDDSRLRDLLRRFLSDNGFRVTVAADAADARQRLGALEFDLIVLDVMMPGESGLDLARALHDSRAIPILMLTAMGEPDDRIAGLESGVDDYLVKPFEPRELLLRLRTILRRARSVPTVSVEEGPASAMVRFGEHIFDIRQTILYRAGRPVRLTEAEAGMLRSFAEA
ncbi:MAG: response regulator, partial [Rhodospirillaceae bacterium]|nr:response regulator [Rhodospirillaceae bacterium]